MSTLYELTTDYQALLELGDSDDPEEQEAFLTTLEGLDFEVGLKADAYAAIMSQLKARAEYIKAEADRLARRAKAAENNVERLKTALYGAMLAMGKTEIKTDLHRFKIVKNGGKQPVTIDEDRVPDGFKRVVYETDKELIRQTLEKGVALEFARLEERGSHLKVD